MRCLLGYAPATLATVVVNFASNVPVVPAAPNVPRMMPYVCIVIANVSAIKSISSFADSEMY